MNTKKIVFSIFKTCIGLALVMLIVMCLIRFSQKAYDFGFRIFSDEAMTPPPGYSTTVTIVEGKSVLEIGETLKNAGLIKDAYLFYLQELMSNYHNKLRPGVYQLSTSMRPEEMMVLMSTEPEEDELNGFELLEDEEKEENDDGEFLGTEDDGNVQNTFSEDEAPVEDGTPVDAPVDSNIENDGSEGIE